MSPTADKNITLTEPDVATRLWLARGYLSADGPTRIGLEALAVALCWPRPPWESAAQAELDAAQQELREASAYARTPTLSAEERVQASRDVRAARLAIATAEEKLRALRPPRTSIDAAAAWALAQMEGAGVPVKTWSLAGDQLLARWLDLLSPPIGDIGATLDFTLPQRASDSAGASNSPINGAATR
jgi:hypothetical protein